MYEVTWFAAGEISRIYLDNDKQLVTMLKLLNDTLPGGSHYNVFEKRGTEYKHLYNSKVLHRRTHERREGRMRRGDNYFIQMGDRWGLVSGPWFDILERSGHNQVRMAAPPRPNYAAILGGSIPDYQPFTTITWRREKWTSGMRIYHAWICEDGLIVPATLNTIGEADA